MDEKEKIDDSIEFCNDMKRYYIDGKIENMDSSSEPVELYKNKKEKNFSHQGYFDYSSIDNKDKKSRPLIWKTRKVIHELVSLSGYIILAFLIAFYITNYIGHHTVVEGISMEDTLHDGDVLLIDKLTYHFSDPERFDIVIFPYKKDEHFIKRVIGLPGETVQIQDGHIYIDGNLLIEDYGKEPIRSPGLARVPIVLGEEQYFVLGDNRNHSQDSRSYDVGLIDRHSIIAKAWLRIYPFSNGGVLRQQ